MSARLSDLLPDPDDHADDEPLGTGPVRGVVPDEVVAAFHNSHPARFRCALCRETDPETPTAWLLKIRHAVGKVWVMACQPNRPANHAGEDPDGGLLC